MISEFGVLKKVLNKCIKFHEYGQLILLHLNSHLPHRYQLLWLSTPSFQPLSAPRAPRYMLGCSVRAKYANDCFEMLHHLFVCKAHIHHYTGEVLSMQTTIIIIYIIQAKPQTANASYICVCSSHNNYVCSKSNWHYNIILLAWTKSFTLYCCLIPNHWLYKLCIQRPHQLLDTGTVFPAIYPVNPGLTGYIAENTVPVVMLYLSNSGLSSFMSSTVMVTLAVELSGLWLKALVAEIVNK